MARAPLWRLSRERFGRGLMLLTLGLAKKVFISDPLAEYVNPIFDQATRGAVSVAEALQATLGFTFQIYFDFSGYTDMALGMTLMLGIRPATELRQTMYCHFPAGLLAALAHDAVLLHAGLPVYPARGQPKRYARPGLRTLRDHDAWGTLAWGWTNLRGLGYGARNWARSGRRLAPIRTAHVGCCRLGADDAALRVYEGLFGFAPLGDVFKWRAIAIAAAIACLGPTAWSAIQLVPPHRWVAVGFAAVLMAVLGILLIGGSAKVSPDEPPNPC